MVHLSSQNRHIQRLTLPEAANVSLSKTLTQPLHFGCCWRVLWDTKAPLQTGIRTTSICVSAKRNRLPPNQLTVRRSDETLATSPPSSTYLASSITSLCSENDYILLDIFCLTSGMSKTLALLFCQEAGYDHLYRRNAHGITWSPVLASSLPSSSAHNSSFSI